jgi:hypothetical protein
MTGYTCPGCAPGRGEAAETTAGIEAAFAEGLPPCEVRTEGGPECGRPSVDVIYLVCTGGCPSSQAALCRWHVLRLRMLRWEFACDSCGADAVFRVSP